MSCFLTSNTLNKSKIKKKHTFGSRFNVISKNGTLPWVPIDPRKPNGRKCLRELKVSGSPRGTILRSCSHLTNCRGTIVNSLGPDTEGVRDPLLKIVNVHKIFWNPLLHLLGVICKNIQFKYGDEFKYDRHTCRNICVFFVYW